MHIDILLAPCRIDYNHIATTDERTFHHQLLVVPTVLYRAINTV